MIIMNRWIAEQFKFSFGGGGSHAPSNPKPEKPPVPPTQDAAAKGVLQTQGKKKVPVGFESTILGDNTSTNSSQKKTLLGA